MSMQAVPTRPWEKEQSVRRRSAAMLLLGALISYAVVMLTGFAGPDHPMMPVLAESAYLKSLFFRLD